MSEPGWYRQKGLACEFCGAPGHLVPIAPRMDVRAVSLEEAATEDLTIKTRIACPEHRFLVIQRAEREQAPERYAQRHGRPDEWGETGPERTSRALRSLLDRLRETAPDQVADIEAKARDKVLL